MLALSSANQSPSAVGDVASAGGGIRGGRLTSTRGQSFTFSLSNKLLLFRSAVWKLSETFPAVTGAAASAFGFGVLQNSGVKVMGEAVAILHRPAVAVLAREAVKEGRGSGATTAGGPIGGGGGMVEEAGSRAAAATALV
jgi:hypothetical protein